MESAGVLITVPMSDYLDNNLQQKFNVYRLWEFPSKSDFLSRHAHSIRAVVGDTRIGADAELIEALPCLEIVASNSVGLDKIDLNKCKEKGIRVTNTPDVLTDDVADAAIGLALMTLRRFCRADRFVRDGLWRTGFFDLANKFTGKSIGIEGLGRIGSAIAKRASAFNCTVSYHSRSKKPDSTYKYYSNIIDLAANSEILFISCSLTPETRHIVNRDVLDALGPKGVLINVGRGAHVDERELVSALQEGRVAGAGIDVFENEPDVPEELFGMENVVLLPHIASDTVETATAMADLVVGNLVNHFSNKSLLSPVV